VYFGLYCRDLWGNCSKLSHLMCPYRGIKCPHLILGVLLPKIFIFGPKNVVFHMAMLRLYCRYLQIGAWYRNSKKALHTAITPVHGYQIWWTLVYKRKKWDRFSTHSKINFFGRSYLRSYELCCPLKISQLVKDDHWLTLANAYLIGHGSAPNNF